MLDADEANAKKKSKITPFKKHDKKPWQEAFTFEEESNGSGSNNDDGSNGSGSHKYGTGSGGSSNGSGSNGSGLEDEPEMKR